LSWFSFARLSGLVESCSSFIKPCTIRTPSEYESKRAKGGEGGEGAEAMDGWRWGKGEERGANKREGVSFILAEKALARERSARPDIKT